MPETPSIKTIAAACGVSTYVVSLALRGLVGVAPATRQRVEDTAAKLGYQADPAAAALGRRHGGRNGRRLTIGLIADLPWDMDLMKAACAARGFEARLYLAGKLPPHRQAARLLWQEGVDGLVVASGPHAAPFWSRLADFDWTRFSIVKLTRALPELPVPVVRHSPFDYMLRTLEAVETSGYRRIAVLLHRSASAHDDRARLGAVLAFAEERKHETNFACAWHYVDLAAEKAPALSRDCLQWLRRFAPDAVVSDLAAFGRELASQGWSIPRRLGYAAVLRAGPPQHCLEDTAGCEIQLDLMYRQAVELLEKQILHGERGLVRQPLEVVIEPLWRDGRTLPPRKKRRAPR